MNKDQEIHVRVRLIVIKNGKLLVQYTKKHDFYYYFGGHVDFGETIMEACIRETREECGQDVDFDFKKILYIKDFLKEEENEHSVEFFILGNLSRTEGLEGLKDPQKTDGSLWLTWLPIDNLPDNLLPHELSKKLVEDYKLGFPSQGEYVGRMDK